MASIPIISWNIEGKKKKESGRSDIFDFLEFQNHCDCSHEIKRHLLLRRISMKNLGSVLKGRNFADKVHIVKAMVLPIVMYETESWIIRQAEHQRIDTFKLWCWRRPFRVPWTARISNQLILK